MEPNQRPCRIDSDARRVDRSARGKPPSRRVARPSDRSATSSARFLGAHEVATRIGVQPRWVFDHAREIGGVRLGPGRGKLRFDL